MATIDDEILQSLLKQLAAQDRILQASDRSYQLAKASLEVATAQYAALRDLVTRRLGYSPYAVPEGLYLADEDPSDGPLEFPTDGRFRFVNMAAGDAAIAALNEVDEPMSLEELVDRLKAGGIAGTREMLTRSINAALMRKTGIGKTADGRYYREGPGADEDFAVLRNMRRAVGAVDDDEGEDEVTDE